MHVAYAYELDAGDINTQSGHPYSILKQIERKTSKVERLFPLNDNLKYLFGPRYLYHRLRGETYRPDRERMLLKSLAGQIERRMKGIEADFIFCPGSHAIAELQFDLPKIFCADATFANVLEFYGDFSNVAPSYLEQGHYQEAKALANCAAAIYPSEWAAQSAIRDYGANPERVHVVPFGANIDAPPRATVLEMISRRRNEPLRLLFIGREWKRKGGGIVLETAKLLAADRMPLELHLVGISEDLPNLPTWTVNHGLLNKTRPADRRIMNDLLSIAHFMFVPSRAENYGMVFCEAAAYGMPSISTAVGGIPTIVREGVTGSCLSLDATPAAYAEVIGKLLGDWNTYRDLCLSSLDEYWSRLNWDSFGNRFLEITGIIASR